MRKLALLVAALAVGLVAHDVLAQAKCGNDFCMGSANTQLHVKGNLVLDRAIFPSPSTSKVIVDGGLIVVGEEIVQNLKVLTYEPGDAGTNSFSMEAHQVVMSTGTKTYTFNRAFAFAPMCVCSDTASTAAACSVNGVTSTQVVVKGGTSAVIDLICVGDR